ncbi:globin [Terricaulis sp.]|uniref:globin n=1 Tax=Terricaulis sp. TaxID=2768686 RepID=UPI0037851599
MDSADAAAIAASLELAAEHRGDLTPAVYARLFAEQPEMRPLFVMDTNDAVKGEMLARVFDAILDFTGERRYAHMLIEAEASNHEGYNVPRAVFASFFQTVSETVKDACGAGWTEAMAGAWARLTAELGRYVAPADA